MLVNSRCFPDEVIFNRHLADVHVLTAWESVWIWWPII